MPGTDPCPIPSAPAGVGACSAASYACANYARTSNAVATGRIETPQPVNGSNASASAYCYDDGFSTANLINAASWDSTLGGLPSNIAALINCAQGRNGAHAAALVSSSGYDTKGNLLWQTDPKGQQTTLEYQTVAASNCSANTPFLNANATVQMPYVWKATNPLNQTVERTYDCRTGVLNTEKDPNTVQYTFGYDRFARLTSSNVNNETMTRKYSDVQRFIVEAGDLDGTGDQKLVTIERMDQLGRRRLVQQFEAGPPSNFNDESLGILVQSRESPLNLGYDSYVSQPYRTGDPNSPATGWTVGRKDATGRQKEVRHYSGFGLPSLTTAADAGTELWAYDGATITATDADSKIKSEQRDGLGRLVKVTEAGAFDTTYSYNHLGNLTGVCQGPGCQQTRSFVYSSLGRLQSAQNPEAAQIAYVYDKNGNLKNRTQSGQTIDIDYDALNRPVQKRYSGNLTPQVAFCYDGQQSQGGVACANPPSPVPFAKGRLTSVSSLASASLITEYDARGRVLSSQQITPSFGANTTATLGYRYNFAGQLRELTLPSQKKVSYLFDPAGRVTTVKKGDSTSAVNYASGISYSAHGAVSGLTFGNNLTESAVYNTRLQMAQLSLGSLWSLKNVFGGSRNNGNVLGQEMTAPGASILHTGYSYDALNRLAAVGERAGSAVPSPACSDASLAWCYEYGYDQYGNRRVNNRAGSGTGAGDWESSSYNLASNRIANAGWDYDLIGNIIKAPAGANSNSLLYDVEGHVVAHCKNEVPCQAAYAANRAIYTYDALGRRVKKMTRNAQNQDEETVFVYDAAGQLTAEYSNVVPTTGTQYPTYDHLGSMRVLSSSTGAVQRFDYEPFGQTINAVGGSWRAGVGGYLDSDVKLRFTGKERDAETGLDYFGARYMSATQGRFTSADPKEFFMRTIANPQKWNKYAYTLNNPLALVDPDGREEVTVTYRAFIPSASVTVFGKTNGGDARGFSTAAQASSRTSISIRLETDPSIRPGNPIISVASHAGASTTIVGGRIVDSKTGTLGLPTATGSRDANGTPIVNIQQDTKNPLSPGPQALTPGISANLNVMVYQDASTTLVTGTAAQFPASELNVTRQDGTTTPVIQFMPPTGATPFSLLQPDRTVNERRSTPACHNGDAGCPQ